MTQVLVADIGGTNADIAIAEIGDGIEILHRDERSTDGYSDFHSLVEDYCSRVEDQHGAEIEKACFAVAGPVKDGSVEMPHSNILVDSDELEEETGLDHVLVINDFDAIGYAVNTLEDSDVKVLQEGEADEGEAMAVVGAGTGLGKDILVYDSHVDAYIPSSSEGGHADLPVVGREESKMARFLEDELDLESPVQWEHVLSGPGLENIYSFLRQEKYGGAEAGLSAEEIARLGNECSEEAFEWFIRFYGRCAKNFALDVYATGGVYIAGGIAAGNPEKFDERFLEAFKNSSGQFQSLLEQVPVRLVTNYYVSLKGAAKALEVEELGDI